MTIAAARKLLSVNINNLSLEQLQKHRVRLIDAWRESKAAYGMGQAVKNGFYKIVESSYASGFTPSDMWLTHELNFRLDEVYALETSILKGA